MWCWARYSTYLAGPSWHDARDWLCKVHTKCSLCLSDTRAVWCLRREVPAPCGACAVWCLSRVVPGPCVNFVCTCAYAGKCMCVQYARVCCVTMDKSAARISSGSLHDRKFPDSVTN